MTLAELQSPSGKQLMETFYLVDRKHTADLVPFSITLFNETVGEFEETCGVRVRENPTAVTVEAQPMVTQRQLADTGRHDLSDAVFERVFSGAARPLRCPAKGRMYFWDYVWFTQAEQDRMLNASCGYWVRALDMDGDGRISTRDLEHFYVAKMKHGAVMRGGGGDSGDDFTERELAKWRKGFRNTWNKVRDAVRAKQPHVITAVDVRVSKAGEVLYSEICSLRETGGSSTD